MTIDDHIEERIVAALRDRSAPDAIRTASEAAERRIVEGYHPDECQFRGLSSRRSHCVRDTHPTPTSDCSHARVIPHVSSS